MHPSPEHEAGYTAIEAIVAIVLISIVGFAAAALSFGGIRSIDRSNASGISSLSLLSLDDSLRAMARRIRIPYWQRGVRFNMDSGSVSVPYYEGEAGKFLRLSLEENCVTLSAPNYTYVTRAIDNMEIKPLLNTSGEIAGLVMKLRVKNKEYKIVAPFGASALPKTAGT